MPETREIRIISEETLQRMAHILGHQSASAQALMELRARCERGEDVIAFIDFTVGRGTIVVGPAPETPS